MPPVSSGHNQAQTHCQCMHGRTDPVHIWRLAYGRREPGGRPVSPHGPAQPWWRICRFVSCLCLQTCTLGAGCIAATPAVQASHHATMGRNSHVSSICFHRKARAELCAKDSNPLPQTALSFRQYCSQQDKCTGCRQVRPEARAREGARRSQHAGR